MLAKINKEDLVFFETLRHPKACAEILFHDADNLGSFSENEYGEIRTYQIPFLSYDSLFCEDKKLSKRQNFEIKKGLGENFALGGRMTGKTFVHLKIDCLVSSFLKVFNWCIISSADLNHIRGVMDVLVHALRNHTILKHFRPQIKQSPAYTIHLENGCLIESVNNNLSGKNPGFDWFGKHCDRNYEEETSFVTEEISNKKKLGVSELGCIFRLSGMTTFSKLSPMGRLFYDYKNIKKIINLPSYVNSNYDENKDNELIQEFGGKQSHGYEVQVKGKVIESGDSVFLIDEIRKTYKNDKKDNPILIKTFEINKDNISKYKDKIILNKAEGIERTCVALDKGEGAAPTEIIVLFKIGKKWKYEYNITLFRLTPDQDEEIINYVIDKVCPNIIGIDSTSDKTLLSNLSKKYGEAVHGINFNESIEIGFKTNIEGKVECDESGKPLKLKDDIVNFSIQCLKDLFYKQQIECLTDYKLDQQFDGVISSTTNKGKIIYGYKTENHLFQAFQVFAITNWITEKKQLKPISQRKPGIGVIG